MYHIIYAFLYTISLLPFFVLYGISDVAFFLLYYIFGYRKIIVMGNLNIAFPEKTIDEKKRIARKFYRNLTDTFIETIKLLSISKKEFDRRASINMSEIIPLLDKGKTLQVHCGHQMNWEYGHQVFARGMPIRWVGVYMRINNKAMERLILKIRNVGNTVMVPLQEFGNRTHNVFKKQFGIGLIADQNPGIPSSAYWLNFFNRPVPFIPGPEKAARRNNSSVIFVNGIKIKRGFYHYKIDLITENGSEFSEGELTLLYRDYLEAAIRLNPDNYLWTHKRWKWPYNPQYKKRWIDTDPPPSE